MNPYHTDAFIAGGGPAGLAAAIALRRRGLQVLVADAAKPPIDKACGEGLMPDSLNALSALGITVASVETASFRGIRFVGPDRSVEASFPNGIGLGIRRKLLHSLLIDRAREVGARLLWGTRVETRDGELKLNGEPVRYRWLVGADGNESAIRRFAALESVNVIGRRIGCRRHFRVRRCPEFVEIHWGENCQAYVTPIASGEVCVALISRAKLPSFEAAIAEFPALADLLRSGEASSPLKGAVTYSRRLRSVTRGNVALIGEASGSVDAITGEGLAMGFRQALALADAIANGNLSQYESAHRFIMQLPMLMGRTMLLMDNNSWVRRRSLHALSASPRVFGRFLSVHVGALPLTKIGLQTALDFGCRFLTA